MQVVARSLETALHKLHELKFDLDQVVSGFGFGPAAAGRQGRAERDRPDQRRHPVRRPRRRSGCGADDDQLAEVGPKVPSSASPDHGAPFAAIFERYGQDFYKIDPMLFSPAEIVLNNLRTGRSFVFGRTRDEVLQQSFFG